MTTNNLSTVLGPLASLYADPAIYEIFVDGFERVYVVRSGTAGAVEPAGVTFDSPQALHQAIEAILAAGGMRLDSGQSVGEARLADGVRVVAVLPPTAVNGPYLTIRKPDQDKSTFTWEQLLTIGTLSAEAHTLLLKAIDYGANLLIVGNTQSSGKDYVVNLLAESLPAEARVVVAADAYNLPVANHPRRIHLETGGPAHLSADDVLATAAKMRPNWLVIGDLQGAETMRAVQLMNNGQPTLATLYADSPEDALARLEAMCLMANPSLGLAEIRRLIASAISLIVFQQNHVLPDYRIKITHLVEVSGVKNDRYVLQPLFTYDNEQGVLQPTEAGQTWADRQRQRLTRG